MNLQKHIENIRKKNNSRKCNREWFDCCQEIIATEDFDTEVKLLSPFYTAYLACFKQKNQQDAMQDAIDALAEHLLEDKKLD